MSLSIREAMRKWVPPWLADRGPDFPNVAFKILYTFGTVCDAGVQWILEGFQAKLPGVGTPTALPRIGRDRQIIRGLSEPDSVYSTRLVDWLNTWKHAGGTRVILTQIRDYLFPSVPLERLVNANATWRTLNPDDTIDSVPLEGNWDWDGQPLAYRFWPMIYSADGTPTSPFDRDGTWGDGEVWGDTQTSTWGSTATPDQVATIRTIIGQFKSAESVCNQIVIVFDNAAFDPTGSGEFYPDGDWRYNSEYEGGVQIAVRDDRAIYLDGVA